VADDKESASSECDFLFDVNSSKSPSSSLASSPPLDVDTVSTSNTPCSYDTPLGSDVPPLSLIGENVIDPSLQDISSLEAIEVVDLVNTTYNNDTDLSGLPASQEPGALMPVFTDKVASSTVPKSTSQALNMVVLQV